MEGLGGPQGMRALNTYDVIPGGGDPGRVGGGTYTNPRGDGNRDPTIQVCMACRAVYSLARTSGLTCTTSLAAGL